MERLRDSTREQSYLCEGHNCSATSVNLWKTHRKDVCNTCTVIFHYQWDVKIKDAESFLMKSMKILDEIVEEMEKKGFEYELGKECTEFEDWVKVVKEKVAEFHQKIREEKINRYNEDTYVVNWRSLLKGVLESQAYR